MPGKFPLFPFSSYAFAFPDNFSVKTSVLGTPAHTCDLSWESEASLVSLVSFTSMTVSQKIMYHIGTSIFFDLWQILVQLNSVPIFYLHIGDEL